MPNLLDETAVRTVLRTRIFGKTVCFHRTLDSTNSEAKRLARDGSPEGTLICAEHQTHGRGRWSRSWESPSGKGLWFSLILRPVLEPDVMPLITLMAANAVAKAVESRTETAVEVRWPNDLFVQGRKLAGILTEISQRERSLRFVILGIGINVNQKSLDFPPEIRDRSISLAIACGRTVERLPLFSEILVRLEKDYLAVVRRGFRPVLRQWMARSGLGKRNVEIRTASETHTVRIEDVTENGEWVARTEHGRRILFRMGSIREVGHASGR